jgi:ankyrin repeat protein
LDQNTGNLTPFYLATSFNHVHVVKLLIKHDARQLSIPNREGWTPLHKACDIGLAEMVNVLLDLGAEANAQDYKGLTPLHLASRKAHFEVVQILTKAGANIHATDKNRLTPLDFSTMSGHVETVKLFLDHGSKVNHRADDGWTPLHRAGRGGHKDIVSLLLSRGAELMTQDYKGNIPLLSAVRSGRLDVVSVLLDHDPELRQTQIFHRDKRGEIARMVAFYTAHPDISKHLRVAELEYVPADNAPANQLTRAIEEDALAAVKEVLAQNPTSIDEPDSDGQPPLHVAIQEQSVPIATFLIESGASIESLGYHGWRPLQIAASLGNLELVQLCLSHNANVLSMSSTGQTVLHKACSGNSIAVVRLLLRHGADPHSTNNRGMTPLHIAAAQNQLDIARYLVGEHNVDVTVLDKTGDSPSKWASRSGHYEMLEYLRDQERRVKEERKMRAREARKYNKSPPVELEEGTSTAKLVERGKVSDEV